MLLATALLNTALAEAMLSQRLPSQLPFQAQNRYVWRRMFSVQMFLGVQSWSAAI
jgi:hypothetical protein